MSDNVNGIIKQCSKGHFYNPALGPCPMCAAEQQNSREFVMSGSGVDDIPATAPATFAGGMDRIGETMPGQQARGFNAGQTTGETVAEEDAPFTATDFFPAGSNTYKQGVENYGKTETVSVNNVKGFDPVVGWLICTEGPNRGRDYRIFSGINTIGRLKSNTICIENDETISQESDTLVSFDVKSTIFYISKGQGRNIIHKNEKPVFSAEMLSPYDKIQIGNTQLVFIPLCGENFKW